VGYCMFDYTTLTCKDLQPFNVLHSTVRFISTVEVASILPLAMTFWYHIFSYGVIRSLGVDTNVATLQ
jgi:hypothetical protein